jgi:phenylalanine-4-hydroxylase
MHTDPAFADALVRFGECAHAAAEYSDPHVLANRIRALARFFWFTVEFGLMRSPQGYKVYGSGLLSSHGEIAFAVESPHVQRYPLQLEWVINQPFEIDHYQPLLFTISGFAELYEQASRLNAWMRAGKLDHVAPGEPAVNERDLRSFLG